MPGKREAKNRGPGVSAAASLQPTTGRLTAPSPTVLGILSAFAAIALYLPALPYGWVWDDQVLVASQGAGGVGAEGFRLLTSLLYRLEWTLGFGAPSLAHMTSILLHGLATWLFFRFALHVGARPGIAFAATLLFAAHPVHAEAVAYVSGRPDLLATVFVLTALLLARSAEDRSPEGRRSWKIWAAYAAMAAAVLSDEVAIVTPLILVGLDLWGPVRERRRLAHYSGFFAIALVYLLVRYTVGGGATPAPGTADSVSGIEAAGRSWAVPVAFSEYLKVLVLPHPLNAIRSLHASEAASWAGRLAPFGALAALALVVLWRRRDPLARVGALLTVLALLPALPLPWLIGSFVEERETYLASVGFCLIVASVYGWIAGRLRIGRPLLALGTIAIAAVAGLATLVRLPVWQDNISFLSAAAEADPTDPIPHLTLADYYAHGGMLPVALRELDRAIEIDPKSHAAVARRTATLSRMGRYPEAEASARRAIELDPKDASSYVNLSDALLQQQKIEEAIAAGRRAVEIDSTLADAWYNYGVALSAHGDLEAAIPAYRKAIEIQPTDLLALNNLGALLGSTNRLEEARDLYSRLVALAPNSVRARMNLALAYLRTGDRESAAREREAVRKLDPAAVRELDRVFNAYVNQRAEPGARKGAR